VGVADLGRRQRALPGKVLSVGAFYHPHLARETLELAGFIQHLAMADPPRTDDPLFAKVRTRFTLLLHDFLGQLSEPVEASALERARRLVALYDPPWVAEHLQRVHTTAGDAFVDYVFPPPYTEDLLRDYARNARALQAALGRPLVLEPIPTYLRLDVPQLDEAAFDVLPDPRSEPIRLLVTLAPDGRVTTVRASEALERVLTALEAPQTAAALARALGTDEAACGRALQQLAAIGAVAWRDA
jgi:Protein of unknown function (DUF692)